MPSDSRNTVRRNFSINQEASQAIDSFAEEHNLTKSKVVEKAVMEYTGQNATGRIEQKVDQILAAVEEGSVPPTQTSGKRKNSRSDSTDFDPAGYDPNEVRDEPLSKVEINELVKTDEPIVNPAHIDENNLPGSTREKTSLMAAVVRYNAIELGDVSFKSELIERAIRNHLGNSDYLLDQYVDPIGDKFVLKKELEFNRDDERYEVRRREYFPAESYQREYYQERYETIQAAVNSPVDEMPVFDLSMKPYEFLRQWLTCSAINSTLQELEIATDDEITDLVVELASYRGDIDQCLNAINEMTSGSSPDFNREEAIEVVPYNEEQSESMVTLLENIGYIGEYSGLKTKDMGLDNKQIIWWA